MKKTILFLTISFCFIVFSAIAQEQKMDHDPNNCFRNQKKNNFIVGDTLYSHVINDDIIEDYERENFYLLLLDNLAVSLKKDTSISLIINGLNNANYEEDLYYMEHNIYFKKRIKDFTFNWNKKKYYEYWHWMANFEAGCVKRYLRKKGVKNCMICYGVGPIKWDEKISKIFKYKSCLRVVQIILTKADSVSCFSLKPDVPFAPFARARF